MTLFLLLFFIGSNLIAVILISYNKYRIYKKISERLWDLLDSIDDLKIKAINLPDGDKVLVRPDWKYKTVVEVFINFHNETLKYTEERHKYLQFVGNKLILTDIKF